MKRFYRRVIQFWLVGIKKFYQQHKMRRKYDKNINYNNIVSTVFS